MIAYTLTGKRHMLSMSIVLLFTIYMLTWAFEVMLFIFSSIFAFIWSAIKWFVFIIALVDTVTALVMTTAMILLLLYIIASVVKSLIRETVYWYW